MVTLVAHKMLVREAKREALTRMEDAARTVADFENVTEKWDVLDGNRERKERYWEKLRKDELLNWQLTEQGAIAPQPMAHVYGRQQLKGEFLDTIYDCPHEMHEMVWSKPVFDMTRELDELHKDLLYYRGVRLWSPQKIAQQRGQTDRNVRKVYNKMIDDAKSE